MTLDMLFGKLEDFVEKNWGVRFFGLNVFHLNRAYSFYDFFYGGESLFVY